MSGPPSGRKGVPLKSRLASGSLWTLGGYAASQVFRLVSNLLLWRLLDAEAFGIMAIVQAVMQGLQMFSDLGIQPSIVQNKREDDTYLNTAWTIQVVRGFGLAIAAAALTVPVAHFYEQDQLMSLIPVVGLGCIAAGFVSTRVHTAARHIAVRRLTIIDLACQVAGLVVTVLAAWTFRSVWALVAGGLASGLLKALLSHTVLPGIRNRLVYDAESAHTLLRFGRWIFLSTLLTFATAQLDRLIFGKVISLEQLGVYSIATVWATLPHVVVAAVFRSAVFPALSRVFNEGKAFTGAFRDSRYPWLMLGGYITSCLAGGGPILIRALYDERAQGAGWVIQVLALSSWLLALETTRGTALLAQGRAKWVAAGSAAKLVGMISLLPIGFHIAGFRGAVVGLAAAEGLRYVVSVIGGARIGIRDWSLDLLLSFLIATTGGAAIALGTTLRPSVDQWVSHDRLAAFGEGAVVWLSLTAAWAAIYGIGRRLRTSSEAEWSGP